jgi:1,4-alpha-glucan branching enzyme
MMLMKQTFILFFCVSVFMINVGIAQSDADSVTITFRTQRPPNPVCFVPGEFNNWGPNNNGVIVPGAPSEMMYDSMLSAWTKTYTFKIHDPADRRRTMGDSVFQYKFNQGGCNTCWYSDELNPETNPNDFNNSVLRLTKLFWFEYYPTESGGNITRITIGLPHSNSDTIWSVLFTTGASQSPPHTTIDVTSSYDESKRVLDFVLENPIPSTNYVRLVAFNNLGDSVVYARGGYVIHFIPMPSYANHGVTVPSVQSNDSTTFRIRVTEKDYILLHIAPLGQNPVTAPAIVMRRATNPADWWMNVKLDSGTYEYLYEIENGKMMYDPWGKWNGQYGSRFTIGAEGLTADNYIWQNTSYQRPPLNKLVIYEVNIGEFVGGWYNRPPGQATFRDFTNLLWYFDSLGVNAIELMPINDYGNIGPSGFSWGYDLNSFLSLEPGYGTPEDFKELVDSAHGRGIAIIVDAVYNHLNETSPLWQMQQDEVASPYFKYCGDLRYNEDGLCFFKDMDHWTNETQELVLTAIRQWLDVYHIDGFRYDYTQGIGWRVSEPTKGILGWTNKIDSIYNGTVYQIVEHLPESPALVYYSGVTSDWHDAFHDRLFDEARFRNVSLTDFENYILGLSAFPGNDDPPSPSSYASRTEPVNHTNNHDEQSVIFEMITFQGVDTITALQRDRLYATFMFTSLGVPMLWQGQEFGEPRGWHNDGERLAYRPMDFSWFYRMEGQTSFRYYQRLIFQRQHNPALYNGTLRKLYRYNTEKTLVWGFEDSTSGAKVMAIANLSNVEQTVRNVPWLASGTWYDVQDQAIFTAGTTTIDSIILPAFTAKVYSNMSDSALLLISDVKEGANYLPKRFEVLQNYPNPFNPQTKIRYQTSEVSHVTLKVFNVLGQEVVTLVDEMKHPGEYEVTWDASKQPSGVYFYKFTAGKFTTVNKMLLIR